MNKLAQFTIKLTCFLAVLGWSMSAYGQGDNKARPLGSTSSPYGYYEYLPVDYNSNSNNYPVLIFLHGLGEKGNGTTQLGDAIKHGPQREVANGRDFPFIIVSPQTDVWWSVDKMNSFIEWVKNRYRVNADKVYLTGLSMGGISTFDYVNKYPNQLAAIVPIAGENKRLSNSCNITHVKLWAFHGDADATINVQKSIDAVKAYNACNPNPLGKLTIYPGVGHNSWTRTYDGSAGHDIYKWMLQYSRAGSKTSNAAPTASAGSDKSVTLPTNSITLYGSASDSDGSLASTTWTKVSGPSASMSGSSTLTLKLSSLLEGTYTFRLTAKDNVGAIKTDDMVLIVKPQSTTSDPVTTSNGLNYKFYTTSSSSPWKVMPNFSNLTPAKTGTLSNISLSPKTQSNYLAFLYEGQIQIDASGTYNFYTYSDDGSQLYINGNLVVNNDGVHAGQERSGSVYLAAGKHNIKVTYFEYANGETLTVKYAGPGISKQTIPNSKLFKGSSTTTNATPTASAGSDKSITLPTNTLTIYGSASDSDGSIASTTWTKVNGPSASMSGTSTTTLKLSSLLEGTYTFRLTAKDNAGATKTDDMVVTVKPQSTTTTSNGLKYKYYTTSSSYPWKVLPNFSNLTPAKTGTLTNFSLSPKTQSNYFAFMYEGQIQIDASGTYNFYTYSDDGSQLFINGNLVANNDGAHAAQERSGSVYLAAGKHNIKVTYFEHNSSEVLAVKYAGPGISKQTIPNTKLYTGSSTTAGSTTNTGDENDSYTGTAPNNLTAVVNPYYTGAGLSWKDNSSNEKGFEIFMSVGNNSNYKQVGSTGSNKTSYGVGISRGQVYYFKIRAKIGTGHSAFSNEFRLSTVIGSSSVLAVTDSVDTVEYSSLSAITEVSAYPNPSTDHINVNIGSEFNGNVKLQLINMAGQVQISESIHTAETVSVRLELNQYQLQPGMYILKVSDGLNQKSLKILKK